MQYEIDNLTWSQKLLPNIHLWFAIKYFKRNVNKQVIKLNWKLFEIEQFHKIIFQFPNSTISVRLKPISIKGVQITAPYIFLFKRKVKELSQCFKHNYCSFNWLKLYLFSLVVIKLLPAGKNMPSTQGWFKCPWPPQVKPKNYLIQQLKYLQ